MAQVIALARSARASLPDWLLRPALVCGCALALICAGPALPLL